LQDLRGVTEGRSTNVQIPAELPPEVSIEHYRYTGPFRDETIMEALLRLEVLTVGTVF
jgi:hypothetical protein